MIVKIGHRLWASDLRMLACRRSVSPLEAGAPLPCSKVTVSAGGRSYFLCPKRVDVFMSSAGGSLADVRCDVH